MPELAVINRYQSPSNRYQSLSIAIDQACLSSQSSIDINRHPIAIQSPSIGHA
jgi:hypothetical protein